MPDSSSRSGLERSSGDISIGMPNSLCAISMARRQFSTRLLGSKFFQSGNKPGRQYSNKPLKMSWIELSRAHWPTNPRIPGHPKKISKTFFTIRHFLVKYFTETVTARKLFYITEPDFPDNIRLLNNQSLEVRRGNRLNTPLLPQTKR